MTAVLRDYRNSPLKEQVVKTRGFLPWWGHDGWECSLEVHMHRDDCGNQNVPEHRVRVQTKWEMQCYWREETYLVLQLLSIVGEGCIGSGICVRMHLEMSCVQIFVPGKLETAIFRSLRRIFLVLVNGTEGFSHFQCYFQAWVSQW